MSVTPPSSWPWVDHPVSGLRHATDAPCSDSVSLRLPYSVKLATQRKSLTHYTKGTQSPQLEWPSRQLTIEDLFHSFLLSFVSGASAADKEPKAIKAGAPTVCMHAVSGSVSLPFRGSFRLSLTVLVHYRSITSI